MKIFIKGEIFGGGQIMNPVGPMEVGRKSVKEKARDAQLLSRLQESPGHSINKVRVLLNHIKYSIIDSIMVSYFIFTSVDGADQCFGSVSF